LRRAISRVGVFILCCAVQIAAQEVGSHSRRPSGEPAIPHAVQAATGAGPSTFDATMLGSPVLLNKGWRVGISTDLSAAQPGFDDSRWAIRNAQESMADVLDEDQAPGNIKGHPSQQTMEEQQRRYAWFRLHIRLAPQHGPVSLLIDLPVSQTTSLGIVSNELNVVVFANGKRVTPNGPHGDAPQHYQQIDRIYDLPIAPDETSLTLVLRTRYYAFGDASYTNFFAARTLRLGHPEDLAHSLQIWSDASLFERLPHLVDSILLAVLAFFLIALYFAQKGHTEYLWLALHELAQAPIAFVELEGNTAHLDSLWYAAITLQLMAISAYLFFEFLIAFVTLRSRKRYVKWYVRLLRFSAPILGCIGPALLLVGRSDAIGVFLIFVFLCSTLWILAWLAFVVVTLVAATLRRNFEAGLLLIPLALTGVGMIEPIFTAGMSDWSGRTYQSPLTIQAGAIPIHFASFADFTGILVIVLIIFGRFMRIHRDQERAENELAAARSVQELMIPQQKLATPGFEVDSVYDPANEVGGDFFYVQPASDESLLVVIGDVAGKGLKAAMNVSMLMGALRRISEHSPAKILASLNRVLAGSESFTTCQVALFAANGELTIANAGHLPPYLNSQEVALPGSLPLGVLSEIACEETHLYLHPGDRILMLSDGVVEARRPSGELFGFDRVHNLSNQSAFYVAEAARDFGQEDDITVLTVCRLAQALAV
jgi:sigma-B regulation protein RsbU (phosphoserine phosphatase)